MSSIVFVLCVVFVFSTANTVTYTILSQNQNWLREKIDRAIEDFKFKKILALEADTGANDADLENQVLLERIKTTIILEKQYIRTMKIMKEVISRANGPNNFDGCVKLAEGLYDKLESSIETVISCSPDSNQNLSPVQEIVNTISRLTQLQGEGDMCNPTDINNAVVNKIIACIQKVGDKVTTLVNETNTILEAKLKFISPYTPVTVSCARTAEEKFRSYAENMQTAAYTCVEPAGASTGRGNNDYPHSDYTPTRIFLPSNVNYSDGNTADRTSSHV